MKPEKLVPFLQQNQIIPEARAREIAGRFVPRFIPKHDYFLRENQVSQEYLFLEAGFMRSYALDPSGQEVTTGFYGPGQLVFEVSSFFTRVPARENFVALQDCTGCFLTFAALNELFHTVPEFREFGRSILVQGYASLKTRMLTMITETAEERYSHLLATRPDIFQQAPLKHIASYLGITDTSLSRIRKESARKDLLF